MKTPPYRDMTLDLTAGSLAVKAWGPEEGLPIIALHGWMDNASSFDPLLPHLPQFRVYAPDLAGHGRSFHRPPQAPYYIWSYLEEVMAMADKLELKRFFLMGHSMGGAVASLFSAVFPERVHALILLDNLGPVTTQAQMAPKKLRRHILQHKRPKGRGLGVYESFEQAVAIRAEAGGGLPLEAAKTLLSRSLIKKPEGYAWISDSRLTLPSPMSLTEEQAKSFLKSIEAPVLLIATETLWLQPGMRGRTGSVDKLTVVEMEGHHHIHMVEPEAVAKLVARFITQHSDSFQK